MHAKRATAGPGRVLAPGLRIVVHIPPVLAPLPYIAVHIAQPPGVGPLPTHRVRPAARIAGEPCIVEKLGLIHRFGNLVASGTEAETTRTPGAASVLPLSLRGQAVPSTRGLLFRHCGQLAAEFHRVVPRHFLHGIPLRILTFDNILPTARRAEVTRVTTRDPLVLFLSHRIGRQKERLGDSYAMLRSLAR